MIIDLEELNGQIPMKGVELLVQSEKKVKAIFPRDVAKIFNKILYQEDEFDQQKEHFWVAGLTSAGRIKYIELVSLGTLDSSTVHPREVFRRAILNSVDSIIIVHNHPSGEMAPSKDDDRITENLVAAGRILRIAVRDHVILGEVRDISHVMTMEDCFSYRHKHLLDEEHNKDYTPRKKRGRNSPTEIESGKEDKKVIDLKTHAALDKLKAEEKER
ncbi:MAG TPA: JAB domain-containing protein [Syntrophorhabdaceae bacterium]|nr:JAB domain-containing protein [Syntrophorhabdaceae bacterium]